MGMVGLPLDELDAYDAANPFVVVTAGERFRLAAAPDLSWRKLLVAAYHVPTLAALSFPDGLPRPFRALPPWKIDRLGWAYRAHYGLPQEERHAQRLAVIVEKYGAAIEVDLVERHLDLTVEWRARRWRRLLAVIDDLPRASAYMEALSDDDELALRSLQEDREPGPPRIREWSPVVELLTAVVDRVSELIQTTAGVAGAKPGPVRYAPRPVTALERVRNQQRHVNHRRLVAKMLPHKAVE